MCELCSNKKRLGEICLDCHRKKIIESNKEIFDEVDKLKVNRGSYSMIDEEDYQILKEKRLSKTFE